MKTNPTKEECKHEFKSFDERHENNLPTMTGKCVKCGSTQPKDTMKNDTESAAKLSEKLKDTEKKGNDCNHHFEYSHQEKVPKHSTIGVEVVYVLQDVVVCTKCGEVRRN